MRLDGVAQDDIPGADASAVSAGEAVARLQPLWTTRTLQLDKL